jgi:hypothetical protein
MTNLEYDLLLEKLQDDYDNGKITTQQYVKAKNSLDFLYFLTKEEND